jgi:hypothetical protein
MDCQKNFKSIHPGYFTAFYLHDYTGMVFSENLRENLLRNKLVVVKKILQKEEMMKEKGLAVVFSIVFVMMSATCFAMELGIKGGVHMPTGDYGDAFDTGYTFGGQLTAPVSDIFSFGAHVAWSTADFDGPDGDVTMLEFYPYVNFYPMKTDQTSIFVRAGAGINSWEVEMKSFGMKFEDDGTDLMIAAGLGVNLARNLEIVALFNRVFEDDDDIDYYTITVGYNFDLLR